MSRSVCRPSPNAGARRSLPAAVAASGALLVAACGASGEQATNETNGTETTATTEGSTTIETPTTIEGPTTTEPTTTTQDPPIDAPTTTEIPTTTQDPPINRPIDDTDYVDAMERSIAADLPGDLDLDVDLAAAGCIAPVWVDALGADRLVDAGIAPDDLADIDLIDDISPLLDRSRAATMVEALGDCGVDLVAMTIDAFEDLGQLDGDERACLTDVLSLETIEDLFTTYFTDGDGSDPAVIEPLTDALETCVG